MLKVYAILVFGIVLRSSSVAEHTLDEARISFGSDAKEKAFPYMAAIEYNGKYICGAAIIGRATIITAAHCLVGVPNKKYLRVRVGSIYLQSDGELFSVKSYKGHNLHQLIPKNRRFAYTNDVGLIWLNRNITFTKRVQPIKLANSKDKLPVGNLGVAMGWGETEKEINASVLKHNKLKIWDWKKCRSVHRNLDESMFCAGNIKTLQGTCPGDSGSPFVMNGKLYGLVSWGAGCQVPKPGIFTNIPDSIEWIKLALKAGPIYK